MSEVIQGDCVEVMPTLADKSVDAGITVSPYALGLASAWIAIVFLVVIFRRESRGDS